MGTHAVATTADVEDGGAVEQPVDDGGGDDGVGEDHEVTGIVYSGSYLEVSTRLSGQLQNVIVQSHPSGELVSGKSWPGVFIVGPSGSRRFPSPTVLGLVSTIRSKMRGGSSQSADRYLSRGRGE
jgi:hypothetical protein